MTRQYVSVSAITTETDAAMLAQLLDRQGFPPSHEGALGYAVSSRTLKGERRARFIPIETLSSALARGKVRNVIHYTGESVSSLPQELESVFREYCSPALCDSVQINNGPIDPAVVRSILGRIPRLRLIIPIGEKNAEITNLVQAYEGMVGEFLIDSSKGTGRTIDMIWARQAYESIKRASPSANVGFAGGFAPENIVSSIRSLQKFAPLFSVDAESGVRKEDVLSIERAKEYALSARDMFDKAHRVLQKPS